MSSAAKPKKVKRSAFSKFRLAVNVKITVEDKKEGNNAAQFKRLKTIS